MIGTNAFFILLSSALFALQVFAYNSDDDEIQFSTMMFMTLIAVVETTYILIEMGWLK